MLGRFGWRDNSAVSGPARPGAAGPGSIAWVWLLVAPVVGLAQSPDLPTMESVPGDAVSAGPAYDFAIGRFEVTNAQFADFLNAALADPAGPIGQFLFHDTDSGDVFISANTNGLAEVGTNGSGPAIYSASSNVGRVTFSNNLYLAEAGFEDRPVTGVSWYGAVKYCNWLTLNAGFSADQRAYTEAAAANLAGWHPVTIAEADWTVRDLNVAEREALNALMGYRLSMDEGLGTESAFNEWYKAAAWDPDAGLHRIFGFGRSTITDRDANYWNSTDPFDNDTAPVGFFDGVNRLADELTATVDSANAFGLYDMSGNVWEWVQDHGTTVLRRAVRGGSWFSVTDSLAADTRADRSAGSTSGTTGFRVVQSVPGVLAGLLLVTPDATFDASGPFGGDYDNASLDYDLSNVGPQNTTFRIEARSTIDLAEFVGCLAGPGGGLTGDCGDLETDLSGSIDLLDFARVQRGWERSWLTFNGASFLEQELVTGSGPLAVTAAWAVECATPVWVGINTATIQMTNLNDASMVEQPVTLTLTEPLSLAPGDDLLVSGPIGGPFDPLASDFTLTSISSVAIAWSARVDQTWLTVNGTAGPIPIGGELLGTQPEVILSVTLNSEADNLSAGVYTAELTATDSCTGLKFVRSIKLDVGTLTVAPATDADFGVVSGGIFEPTDVIYTLDSLSDATLNWEVSAEGDPTWLLINGARSASGALAPLGSVELTIQPDPGALSLEPGLYETTLRIKNLTHSNNVYELTRQVTLTIPGTTVSPLTDVLAQGPVGGLFAPAQQVYTITHDGGGELPWQASYSTTPAGGDWLDLNGASSASGVILEPGSAGAVDVTVALNESADALPAGSYAAQVIFDLTGTTVTRAFFLQIGEFSPDMVFVLGQGGDQPGGPAYDYRIGKHEVTNRGYVSFLNDALLHLTDERGQYLFHDTDSGDVYLNGSTDGGIGTDGAGTKLFDAAVNGRVAHNGTIYTVAAGFDDYPVTGVSWYGAVKFCNWLTLLKRMGPSDRVYPEGPTPQDWQVTADNATVAAGPGYRLAMDDGSGTATPYNEWYKAAAWLPGDDINTLFGFGRGTLTDADANFLASGDPFEAASPPLAPVGFYEGLNLLADAETVTVNTENGYGLFDLCGNAAEWVHDSGSTTDDRGTRGGSTLNGASSTFLRTDVRGQDSAGATRSFIGFRVVQSVMADPLAMPERRNFLATGLIGGPFTPVEMVYTLSLSSAALGSREWTVTSDAGWLEINGAPVASGSLLPGEVVPVTITFGEGAIDLIHPPGASVSTTLVPDSDLQVGGPVYEYRTALFETSNAQFAQFLNAALASPDDERGYYLFHDTDTGDVYINSQQEGDVGTDGSGVKLFDAAISGAITFNGGQYVVTQGLGSDPAAGVSWYGAVKYCNGLSLSEGTDVNQLAYSEGTTPAAWHPANISDADWALRDLNAAERQELVENYCGYRLPMDDGLGGRSPHNEWYKAAAFLRDVGTSGVDAVYGFGRDVLEGADANYFFSGDIRDDGVTSVGHFNGVNLLEDGTTVTRGTDNAYGLFDMTGNVAEWVQDWGTDGAGRGLRGGGYLDAVASSALTNLGREWADAAGAFEDVGFRVVQTKRAHTATLTFTDLNTDTVTTRQVILVLAEPIEVAPEDGLSAAGAFLGPFSPDAVTYTVTNTSASPMDWQVAVQMNPPQWLDLDVNTNGTVPGRLESSEWIELTLTVNATANSLLPGEYVASMLVNNLTSGAAVLRQIDLTVSEALIVAPEEELTSSGQWLGPFGPLVDGQTPPQAVIDYSLQNLLLVPLNYSVSADVNWLTLNDGDPADGTLEIAGQLGDTVGVPVDINTNADSLAVGEHVATVTFAFDDGGSGGQLSRTVRLTVDDPLEIVGTGGIVLLYEPPTDPASLPATTYTMTNRAQVPLNWQVDLVTDPPGGIWLTLNGADQDAGELLPGASTDVVVTISADVALLPEGLYSATIGFQDLLTNASQTRPVTLTVEEVLAVVPYTNLDSFGAIDDPVVSPGQIVYTVTNRTDGSLDWQVQIDRPWLTEDVTGGTLAVDENVPVTLTLENPYTGPVNDTAQVAFVDVSGGNVTVAIRSVAVTLTEPFAEGASIPANDGQPNGPVYAFEIGIFEVTNAQFASFLNDALNNPTNERGQYMYHDTDSGDVYINDVQNGASGSTGSDTLTVKMFSASANDDRIAFAGAYTVTPGFEDHPVVGVSWYGALKYCNWLTLDQGIGLAQRCYQEGPDSDLSAWRPAAIAQADWQVRDLNDIERQALIDTYRGFRLPMDDGSDNASPFFDTADAFNEWYMAAAWDPIGGSNRLYGFGRDVFDQADANYSGSGDRFESDVLPVSPTGFFDGVNLLGDATTPTADTTNAYGLYDMSGNVTEWMQDRYSAFSNRALRGGSWENFEAQGVWIRTFDRDFASPALTWPSIGFRVMRVAVTPDG